MVFWDVMLCGVVDDNQNQHTHLCEKLKSHIRRVVFNFCTGTGVYSAKFC
jgi:hypothetical protein